MYIKLLNEALKNLRLAQETIESGDAYAKIDEITYQIADLIEEV